MVTDTCLAGLREGFSSSPPEGDCGEQASKDHGVVEESNAMDEKRSSNVAHGDLGRWLAV